LNAPDSALASAEQALAVAVKSNNPEALVRAWSGIGGVHHSAQRFDKAIPAYSRAAGMAEKSGNDTLLAWYWATSGTYTNGWEPRQGDRSLQTIAPPHGEDTQFYWSAQLLGFVRHFVRQTREQDRALDAFPGWSSYRRPRETRGKSRVG